MTLHAKLRNKWDTFACRFGQNESCQIVVYRNLWSLMHVIVVYWFWQFLTIEVAEEVIAMLRICFEEGDLKQLKSTLISIHYSNVKERAEQYASSSISSLFVSYVGVLEIMLSNFSLIIQINIISTKIHIREVEKCMYL